MLPVSSYTFQIQANGAFPLQCAGRYFRINAASGSLKVIGDTFGPMGAVAVGQGLRLPKEAPVFQRLTLVDTSGALNTVTIVVADADFVDNTVLGTVNVVDGGKARTIAGQAFYGFQSSPGVAAQFSYVALQNNLGSGKRAIVEAITGEVPTGATMPAHIAFGFSPNVVLVTVGNIPASKLSGGAAGQCYMRYDSNANNFPARVGAGNQMWEQFVSAVEAPFTIVPKEPLVLLPGWSLVFACGQVNSGFTIDLEFYEEANV